VPFADVLRRSFYRGMSGEFSGLENYISVLQNEAFRLAASNTLRFIAICVPALMVFSLLLSVMLSLCKFGADFFKTTMLIPMALPAASVAFLWKAMFHKNGLINSILIFMGMGALYFMNTDMAFYILIICYIWKNAGYDMVLWTASLSNISSSLYEAASVDGAGHIRQFFFITLPGLKQDFFIIGILSLINSFKVFREAYLVGGAYPHTSMYMLQHLFNNWFAALDMEKLCAGSAMTAFVIFILILLLKRVLREE
jgi:multiple sugar transport system permease protein